MCGAGAAAWARSCHRPCGSRRGKNIRRLPRETRLACTGQVQVRSGAFHQGNTCRYRRYVTQLDTLRPKSPHQRRPLAREASTGSQDR